MGGPSPMAPNGFSMPRSQHQPPNTESHWDVRFPKPQSPKSQEKVFHPQILTSHPQHPGPACLCPVHVESSRVSVCTPFPVSPLHHQGKTWRKQDLHPVPVGTQRDTEKEEADPRGRCQSVAEPSPGPGRETQPEPLPGAVPSTRQQQ